MYVLNLKQSSDCFFFTYEFLFAIIEIGGAPVRCIVYNRWEADMVIPSKEPLASLGAEIVRLGLSVGKQEFEPQCESVKLLSLVKL